MKSKTKIEPETETAPPPVTEAALIPSTGTTTELQEQGRASLSQLIGESPPPLRVAEVISKTTGVCPDVATIVCLSATASAVGPSVMLETPLGELVNSSLILLIPSQSDPGIRSAVGMAFGAYRDSQRASAQEASRIPEKQLEEELAGLVAKKRALHAVTETLHKSGVIRLQQGMTLEDIIDDKTLRGFLEGGFDPAPFRDRIIACIDRRLEEVSSAFVEFDKRTHPASLLEPIRMDDYSLRRHLCKDRGLYSLDEFGLGLEELLAAKGMTKREVGGLWSAAHDGRLIVIDDRARPADWLGGISLVPAEVCKRFLTDKNLQSTGYPQRSLIVVPKKAAACVSVDDDGRSVLKSFSRLLLRRAAFRRSNYGEKLQVAPDANKEVDAILAEQSRVCAEYPDLAAFNQHRATQIFKLALLLHLSMHDKAPRIVSVETIREAKGLMARTLERTLRAQANAVAVKDETGTLEVQLEMIFTKLKIKGPMTRRQLARSFHKVDMGHLHSLVEVACDRGLIEQKGAQLRLPNKPS